MLLEKSIKPVKAYHLHWDSSFQSRTKVNVKMNMKHDFVTEYFRYNLISVHTVNWQTGYIHPSMKDSFSLLLLYDFDSLYEILSTL